MTHDAIRAGARRPQQGGWIIVTAAVQLQNLAVEREITAFDAELAEAEAVAPHIEHFAVKVARFDRGAITTALTKLGASIVPSPDEPAVLRFRDPFGISTELVAV